MKKFFIYSLMLIVGITLFAMNQVEACYAFTNGFIDVIGSAQKIVEPTIANIRFGINTIAEDVRIGQDKVQGIINNIENAICAENLGECEVAIEYATCYPKFNNGVVSYCFTTNVVAKTNDISSVNNIIALACENGATSYYNISYEIDSYEDIYQEVLLLAKENAYNKALTINNNISQIGFKEMSIYNYCNESKIVVEANIRARYEVNDYINNDLNNNIDELENNYEQNKEDYVNNYEIPIESLENEETIESEVVNDNNLFQNHIEEENLESNANEGVELNNEKVSNKIENNEQLDNDTELDNNSELRDALLGANEEDANVSNKDVFNNDSSPNNQEISVDLDDAGESNDEISSDEMLEDVVDENITNETSNDVLSDDYGVNQLNETHDNIVNNINQIQPRIENEENQNFSIENMN